MQASFIRLAARQGLARRIYPRACGQPRHRAYGWVHGWLGGGDFDEDWYRFSTTLGFFLVPFGLILATFSIPGLPWQILVATLGP